MCVGFDIYETCVSCVLILNLILLVIKSNDGWKSVIKSETIFCSLQILMATSKVHFLYSESKSQTPMIWPIYFLIFKDYKNVKATVHGYPHLVKVC